MGDTQKTFSKHLKTWTCTKAHTFSRNFFYEREKRGKVILQGVGLFEIDMSLLRDALSFPRCVTLSTMSKNLQNCAIMNCWISASTSSVSKKPAHTSVPIIPSKLLHLANQPLASPSSFKRKFVTEILALWPACKCTNAEGVHQKNCSRSLIKLLKINWTFPPHFCPLYYV